jgi:hypothetical protein
MTLTTPYLYPERSMVEDLKLMFRAVIPFSHCRPKTSRLLSKHHDLLSRTQRTWNSFWNLNFMISLPTSTIQSFGPNFRTSLIVSLVARLLKDFDDKNFPTRPRKQCSNTWSRFSLEMTIPSSFSLISFMLEILQDLVTFLH